MEAFISQDAMKTKLITRSKNFLTKQEWQEILTCKNFKEIIVFLKSKSEYYTQMELADENMHREQIENILTKQVINEIEIVLNYLSGPYKSFVKTLLMEFEIHDLKLILRAILRGENMEDLEKSFMHSKSYKKLNYEKLLQSKDLNAFTQNLQGTIYYNQLKTFTAKDAKRRAFHMEMKLNLLYYKTLMDKAKALEPKDYKLIQEIIGTKIDCINVQWIYRAKKYYSISKEEMLIYSLPEGHKLPFKKLKELIYTESLEKFKHLAKESIGENLFARSDEFIDTKINKVIYEKIMEFKDEKNISFIVYYIYHLKIEVQELIAVIEGVRYGLAIREIKKYLVYTV